MFEQRLRIVTRLFEIIHKLQMHKILLDSIQFVQQGV